MLGESIQIAIGDGFIFLCEYINTTNAIQVHAFSTEFFVSTKRCFIAEN